MPPSETRTNLRPIELAIDWASEVLPTPGGPRKQRIGPFTSGLSLRTARYSRTRSLTFSRPEWSASSTSLVRLQVDRVLGALRPRQRDDPVEVGARDGVLGGGDRHLRQAIELAQRFLLHRLGHAGRVDLRRAARRSPCACSSPSPSSFWIAFICSRRKYSRWFLPTSDCTCDWIFEPSSSTSSSLIRIRLSDVHPRADVERVEHLLLHRRADGREARGDEVGQLARIGDVRGERLQVVRQQRRQRHDLLEVALDVALQRVDLEVVLLAQLSSAATVTAPRRYGRVWTMRSRRMRASPWTISRRLPSGSLNILWMWVAVPIG